MTAIDFKYSDLPTDIRLDRLIDEADSVEGAAVKLMDQIAVSFFWIGGLVYRLHATKAHLKAGFKDSPAGFIEYMQDKVGLSRRKTYVLARTYRTFRLAGLGAEDLTGLGWRKCEILSRLPTEELREALDRARKTLLSTLEKEIKSTRSTDPRMIKRRARIAQEKIETAYNGSV